MIDFSLSDVLELAAGLVLASLTLALLASLIKGTVGLFLNEAAGSAANSIVQETTN